MCLQFFHLCDKGIDLGPSAKQCNHILTVCDAEELEGIKSYDINIYDYLSKCSQEESPLDIKGCSIANNTSNQIVNCSEGFFYEIDIEGCTPECNVWTPHSKAKILLIDIVTTFPPLIGTISGVAVLLVSWIHHKKL